jgi:hypothetical protein
VLWPAPAALSDAILGFSRVDRVTGADYLRSIRDTVHKIKLVSDTVQACNWEQQMPANFVVLDSVTHLSEADRGRSSYCASHGGVYAGYYAAKCGAGAVIFNDAGVGREMAGVAGLGLLDDLEVPAATVSHRSARIGDGADGLVRGVLSTINTAARSLGLVEGMACAEALKILSEADLQPAPAPPALAEARFESEVGRDGVRVIITDSNSLVEPDDAGHVFVSASHGALLGGRPETAVKYPVFAGVYNDADRGADDAGISRLPALDARGIAGACVSAFSARIGDGRSTYNDGYISAVNETAIQHGGAIGQSCRAFVEIMVEARIKQRGR